MDEMKQVLITLARLEENVKTLNNKIDEFGKISELAFQTDQSVKSAHNRLNDMKIDFDEKMKSQKEDYEEKLRDQKDHFAELKGNITWLWRTVGAGAISLIFGIIMFFIQRFGG